MKTLKISFALSLLLLLNFQTLATVNLNTSKSAKAQIFKVVSNQVTEALQTFPHRLALMGQNEVKVIFHVSKKHILVIDKIVTNNAFLALHVQKNMHKSKIKVKPLESNKTYVLNIDFKL
jgi:hypothetical protein